MTEINQEWLTVMARRAMSSVLQIEQSCRRLMEDGLMALDLNGVPYPIGEAMTTIVTDEQAEDALATLNVERRTEILERMRRR